MQTSAGNRAPALIRIADGATSMHASACAGAGIDRQLVRTRGRADRVRRDR